ncbi:transglutaminase domain-containing protein [Paenibacillus abyssi]|uniref:Transglutaminase-like domain-containing protein n=1 Tax=Paenibacillus abyssi TaxID=1340531 RepID=A0A917LH54_9BACL|nr:transglutaminase domain-containing protein [Paenibacillus abyssi]GGG22736.1 hypothetical protein GCM10010916_44260 [Paenibacillus abyssi]
MKRMLFKLCLLLFVIIVGLGSELKFMPVIADSSSISSLAELKTRIASNLLIRNEEFSVQYSGDKDELSASLPAVIMEALETDDYTGYIVDSYFYTIQTWSSNAKIKLEFVYRESQEQTAFVDRRVSAILTDIIKNGMDDDQIVKQIHDWIIYNVAYDRSYQRYTAYDALDSGLAVCQGYSLLANKMLNMAGIPSRIVEGTVATGDHAWNLVQVDGVWYHMDVTWNDPLPDRGRKADYTYFFFY